ncbi:hypothetical protein ACIA8O_03410 [Kitasatospora sp. NPDC051853]|uniref:hypothetical protein n=1 Tax=Kitasatospora sp. NPDC051853 TaxID=3364058 RepID=UPI0037B734C8
MPQSDPAVPAHGGELSHAPVPAPASVAAPAAAEAPASGAAVRHGLLCLGLAAFWAASAWTAAHVRAAPPLHTAALLVHLVSLVAGFGAVLAVDYVGTLWLLGRRTLCQVLDLAAPLHVPIWGGLAGLTLSGVLLEPHLDSGLTQLKLVLVLLIALNGVQAGALQRRLERYGEQRPPRPLLLRGGLSALVSQLGWWGALLIGFYNAQR